MGLGLTLAILKTFLEYPKAMVLANFFSNGIITGTRFFFDLEFRTERNDGGGIMIIACCPGGPPPTWFTHFDKGDNGLVSISLTAMSSVDNISHFPYWLNFFPLFILGRRECFPPLLSYRTSDYWSNLGSVALACG